MKHTICLDCEHLDLPARKCGMGVVDIDRVEICGAFEGRAAQDQSAKQDVGKLQITLVPTQIISRQAALSDEGLAEFHFYEDYAKMRKYLMSLPPVTPQPKIGHNCNEDYADCDQFICSECGIELQDWHRIERDEDDGEITSHEYVMKYCPDCGAKIVESEKV